MKMKEETKNIFNKYVRYIIVPRCPRLRSSKVDHSKIVLNRNPCFLGNLFQNKNYYEEGSLIVLDTCGNNKSGNNFKDCSRIELYSCDTVDSKTIYLAHNNYEYSYCYLPVFCMIIISLIEVLCFIWDVMTSKTTESIPQGCITSTLIYNPYRKDEVWRFFTYSFIHVGQTRRLTINLIVQLLLGVPLETVHGSWRVVLIYFSGVLASSLATSVMSPSVWLTGASGGVYALIAAHVATVIINWSKIESTVYQLLVLAFFIIFDVGLSVYNRYFVSVQNIQEIDLLSTYLASAIAGLLVGVYIFRNFCICSWEKKLRQFCFVVYLFLIGSAVMCNVIFSEYFIYGQF